jgi:hypothetical protein
MTIKCNLCGRFYDDACRWTICPHGPLGFPHDDYCPRCDTLKTVHGLCRHQLDEKERAEERVKFVESTFLD